jgi:hypothetical protein
VRDREDDEDILSRPITSVPSNPIISALSLKSRAIAAASLEFHPSIKRR